MLDLTNPRLVLAGTVYGECRGGGRIGMENVASAVMNRLDEGWGPNVISVCLAHAQFSCWFDANRVSIENAEQRDAHTWGIALSVADDALSGAIPNRIGHADSYFALSMKRPPYWAKAPAAHVFSDAWHSFWSVRAARPNAANIAVTADDLNAAQLARMGQG